jgi:hypothetical protein
LYDAGTQQAIARYEVQRILFYARGESTGLCAACFAFTWSHGDTLESAIYQCHVFRCDIPEAVCFSLLIICTRMMLFYNIDSRKSYNFARVHFA